MLYAIWIGELLALRLADGTGGDTERDLRKGEKLKLRGRAGCKTICSGFQQITRSWKSLKENGEAEKERGDRGKKGNAETGPRRSAFSASPIKTF